MTKSDPAMFEQFFSKAWPQANRLATAITRDPVLGEEIAQEALTKVYGRWDRTEQPQAYLRASVRNTCNTWYRQSSSGRVKLSLLAEPDRVDFVADELSDAIAVLPYRQRAVIVLRYYHALSEAEIADVIGCRPGTVKSLASRALARLAHDVAA